MVIGVYRMVIGGHRVGIEVYGTSKDFLWKSYGMSCQCVKRTKQIRINAHKYA